MRNLTLRTATWLTARASPRDESGVITAEYLMWGAVAVVAIGTLGSMLFDDILQGLIDRIRDALP